MSLIVNPSRVFHIVGMLLLSVGAAMLVPLITSWIYDDGSATALGISMFVVLAAGLVLMRLCRLKDPENFSQREGMATVAMCWIFASFAGTLPYVLGGYLPMADAIFESSSGFTTTGASVITNIEALPRGILMWRSFSQWLGGMGIIVLYLAILPTLGVGGMQLYKAEVPGPSKDKLTPRLRDTASALWKVYVLLSVVLCILLYAGDMSFFDSLTHTFTTISTAGFSVRNNSIGDYNSAYLQWVIGIFVFISGASFALHYRFLCGDLTSYFKNTEFKVYTTLVMLLSCMVAAMLLYTQQYPSIEENIRHAFFQVSCIITTAGFSTADYLQWPQTAQVVLMLFFFVGGCVGSTSGGLKVMRSVLLVRVAFQELEHLLHPRSIRHIKVDGKIISPDVIQGVVSYVLLFVLLLACTTIVLTFLDIEIATAFWATASCMANVGPAFGNVGPAHNFGHLPDTAKWILSLSMLLGRLEIYTILLLLLPAFWRR